jgi:hypothetical protein
MGQTVTAYIRAQIIRWVSDDFPGFVECRFTDTLGREWSLIEKLPAVTDVDLRSGSQFPQPALVACEVLAVAQDNAGRKIAEITTITPFAIEATDGASRFLLYAEQLRVNRD